MAAKTKTKTETKNLFETATEAFEDAASKAQEQYFSMLEKTQTAALEGYQTFMDTVSKIDMPAVPVLDRVLPDADAVKVPTDAFDGFFDFTMKVLENQRDFAHKMLAVSAKA